MASPSLRAERWWRRLDTHDSATVPAVDLYGGDHWSVAKSLPAVAQASGAVAHLWVASAGYGLVPADAQLRPYSATFATGHLDSVFLGNTRGDRSAFTRDWWARLSEMPSPRRGAPRTVTALVKGSPQACVMVVGSPDYMSAMAADLSSAVAAGAQPDRLIIVSRPGDFARGVLAPHLIPSDARLQRSVGGARTSLHIRVGRKILEELSEWEFSASVLREHYRRLLARSANAPTFDRTRLTDAQVEQFIRAERRHAPDISCARALRALRDRGQACEQSRFKNIFHRTMKGGHAS